MAWEDLEQDVAEEFSDNRRLGWVDSGYRFFRRAVRPLIPPQSSRRRRPWPHNTEWKRGWRLRRRFLQLHAGTLSSRCERPGCCNLLAPLRRAKRRFCSSACKDWTPPKPLMLKTCSVCPTTFLTHGRRMTCSDRCRQRSSAQRRAGTAGASAGGGGTGAHE